MAWKLGRPVRAEHRPAPHGWSMRESRCLDESLRASARLAHRPRAGRFAQDEQRLRGGRGHRVLVLPEPPAAARAAGVPRRPGRPLQGRGRARIARARRRPHHGRGRPEARARPHGEHLERGAARHHRLPLDGLVRLAQPHGTRSRPRRGCCAGPGGSSAQSRSGGCCSVSRRPASRPGCSSAPTPRSTPAIRGRRLGRERFRLRAGERLSAAASSPAPAASARALDHASRGTSVPRGRGSLKHRLHKALHTPAEQLLATGVVLVLGMGLLAGFYRYSVEHAPASAAASGPAPSRPWRAGSSSRGASASTPSPRRATPSITAASRRWR